AHRRVVGLQHAIEQMLGTDGLMVEPQRHLARLRERPAGVTVVAFNALALKTAHGCLSPSLCTGPRVPRAFAWQTHGPAPVGKSKVYATLASLRPAGDLACLGDGHHTGPCTLPSRLD